MIAVGFTVSMAPPGAVVRLHAASPDLARRHLSHARLGPCEMVLMGRLYHRRDRLGWLEARVPRADYNLARSNDAALAAALYREGGVEQLDALEGDFVLAGYDSTLRRVVAMRDPLGAYPLFWTASRDRLVLATSIRALTDHLSLAEPDDEYIADYLASPTDSIAELPTERTAYRGVQRLRPGCALLAGPSGDVQRRTFWDWSRAAPRGGMDTMAAAASVIRERLEAAVAERVSRDSRTACHMSGGTDSTAVALLTARHVGLDRVAGLTLVWSGVAGLARESADAEDAARGVGLEHLRVPADDFLEFDDHDRIPPLDEPSAAVVDLRPGEALLAAARHAGADTILNGHGGDHVFHHPAPVLTACLLRGGRLPEAMRLARLHASRRTGSSWEILREALRFLVPLQLRWGLRPWLKGGRSPFAVMTPLQVPPWLRPEFVRERRIAERTMRQRPPRFDGYPFGAADIDSVAGDWHHWHVAVPQGLVESRPFFDTRLLAAAFAIPLPLHAVPHPMKPVLSAALDGIVPARILQRTRKAHFNSTIGGFGRHQPWLERLILEAPLDDGIVDRAALAACIGDVVLGIFRDAPSVGRLRMTLTLLIWLNQRPAWLRQQLPPAVMCESTGPVVWTS